MNWVVYADDNVLARSGIADPTLAIHQPEVKVELNKAGSFQFNIYPTHPHYSSFVKMKTKIDVVLNGERIFSGRVLYTQVDMKMTKKVYCEGAMSYLLDSVQESNDFDKRLTKYFDMTVYEFLDRLLTRHNKMFIKDELPTPLLDSADAIHALANLIDLSNPVTYERWPDPAALKQRLLETDNTDTTQRLDDVLAVLHYSSGTEVFSIDDESKMFMLGTVDADGTSERFKFEITGHQKTLDMILDTLVDTVGGYMMCRRGVDPYGHLRYYLDWRNDYGNENTQPIEFGRNLIELEQDESGVEIFTRLYPSGKPSSTSGASGSDVCFLTNDLGHPMMLKVDSVLQQETGVASHLEETYGVIVRAVEFSDINGGFQHVTNKWNEELTYAKGDFVVYGSDVYKALSAMDAGRDPIVNSDEARASWHKIDHPAYDPTALYDEGDYVTYDNKIYMALADLEAGVRPDINADDTDPAVETPLWQHILPTSYSGTAAYFRYTYVKYPTYNPEATYSEKDCVVYNGTNYEALHDLGEGVQPNTNPSSWKAIPEGDFYQALGYMQPGSSPYEHTDEYLKLWHRLSAKELQKKTNEMSDTDKARALQINLTLKANKYIVDYCTELPEQITLTALDLRNLDVRETQLKLGCPIHVYSAPHGIDRSAICISIQYNLESPEKNTYTISAKRTGSDAVPKFTQQVASASKSGRSSGNSANTESGGGAGGIGGGGDDISKMKKRMNDAESKIDAGEEKAKTLEEGLAAEVIRTDSNATSILQHGNDIADMKDDISELETEVTVAKNAAQTAQGTANTANGTANTNKVNLETLTGRVDTVISDEKTGHNLAAEALTRALKLTGGTAESPSIKASDIAGALADLNFSLLSFGQATYGANGEVSIPVLKSNGDSAGTITFNQANTTYVRNAVLAAKNSMGVAINTTTHSVDVAESSRKSVAVTAVPDINYVPGTHSFTYSATAKARNDANTADVNIHSDSGTYVVDSTTDANLVAANIKKDVVIFGVTGTHEGSAAPTVSGHDISYINPSTTGITFDGTIAPTSSMIEVNGGSRYIWLKSTISVNGTPYTRYEKLNIDDIWSAAYSAGQSASFDVSKLSLEICGSSTNRNKLPIKKIGTVTTYIWAKYDNGSWVYANKYNNLTAPKVNKITVNTVSRVVTATYTNVDEGGTTYIDTY